MSMGIHESQSLLWERMVALSRPFQDYLLPKIKQFFPDFPVPNSGNDALYAAQNVIKEPSLIRVESDEVSQAGYMYAGMLRCNVILPCWGQWCVV